MKSEEEIKKILLECKKAKKDMEEKGMLTPYVEGVFVGSIDAYQWVLGLKEEKAKNNKVISILN